MSTASPAAPQHQVRSFTRLQVVAPTATMTVAVPDDMRLPELLSSLVREMQLDTGCVWRLEHPLHGTLSMDATPQSLELVDGATINLRADRPSPLSELVDDVPDAVGAHVQSGASWGKPWARGSAAGLFLGLGAVVTALSLLITPTSARSLSAVAVLTVAALVLTLLAAQRAMGRTVVSLLAGAVLLFPAMTVMLHTPWELSWLERVCVVFAGMTVGAAVLSVIAPPARPAMRPIAEGAGVVTVAGALFWALPQAGLSMTRVTAVVSVLAVLALGLIVWLVVPTSGLAGLARAVADGNPVDGFTVSRQARGARVSMTAMFLAAAAVGSVCAVILARSGSYVALALGAVVLEILLLRPRSFRFPGHVLALVVPAAVAVFVAVTRIPQWNGKRDVILWSLVGLCIAVPGLLSVLGFNDVWRSRVRLFAGKLETLLLLSVLPLLLGVFDVYVTVYEKLR